MGKSARYHINNTYISSPLNFGGIYLVQIGRRYCEGGDVIPAHPHLNWFEFTVVRTGRGTVITNGVDTAVSAGDIYVSFPCDVHEIRTDLEERMEYDFFSFYCAEEKIKEELESISQEYHGEGRRVFTDGKIAELIKNAISELAGEKQEYSGEVLADIFHLIIIYFIRNFKNEKTEPLDATDAEVLCFRIMSYIDTHIYSIKNLCESLGDFNYNYGYLSGLFKRTTGKTLSEYFFDRKMETARALIAEKKKKIGEIADLLGYNLYSFSKAFKKKYGISPKNFQKQI